MYIGVDIGASKTLIARQSGHEFEIEKERFATPYDFEEFSQTLDQYLQHYINNDNLEAIVVAAPGTIENGTFRSGNKLPWHDNDILETVRNVFGTAPKADLLNDAAAAGLYEARKGAGQDYNTVLYVTLSTGIGSSIIVNESLIGNFGNSEGGQIILDASNNTTFEDIASGSAFVARYNHQGKDETDPAVWSEYGKNVGTGLFSMITLIRPSIVVIGGSMGTHFDKYKQAVETRVQELVSTGNLFTPPVVVAASKPEDAVVYGCINRAKELASA